MEAKPRGATITHVDPRFTRTSALAHHHVPLRAGSDIAFLGGLINYVLQNEKYFREYVVASTNAAAIVNEDFRDTEDLDGLFSGYDKETGSYDHSSWSYKDAEAQSQAGDPRDRAGEHGGEEPRESARADTYGSGGAGINAKPHQDLTL